MGPISSSNRSPLRSSSGAILAELRNKSVARERSPQISGVQTIDGAHVRLSDLGGHAVLVNFLASW
jgi:hypothetical protein